MLPAALRLVHGGDISLPVLLRALSSRPAALLGLSTGRMAAGAPGDIVVFDMDAPFVLDPATLHSRCKNTPFDGARLQGEVRLTLVDGRVVWRK
jgi:dihydroorotase